MLTTALVLAGLAALVHVYIFHLEATGFDKLGRKAFGISPQDAEVMRPWAWNQGFYNLFLAIGTGVGVTITGENRDAGLALVLFGTGAMLAAALVLITSDRKMARGAIVQGLFPALSLLALLVWCLA